MKHLYFVISFALFLLCGFSLFGQLGNPEPSHQDTVYALVPTPDGLFLLSGGADGKILVWDINAGAHLATVVDSDTRIRGMALSGRSLLSGGDGELIREWDLASGNRTADYTVGEGVNPVETVHFSDGNRIVVAVGRGSVQACGSPRASPWHQNQNSSFA